MEELTHTHTWTKTFDIIYCISSELWRARLSLSVNCCCKYVCSSGAREREWKMRSIELDKNHCHCMIVVGVFEMHQGSTECSFAFTQFKCFGSCSSFLLSFFIFIFIFIFCSVLFWFLFLVFQAQARMPPACLWCDEWIVSVERSVYKLIAITFHSLCHYCHHVRDVIFLLYINVEGP